MVKKNKLFLKLPITLTEKNEAGYKEFFLESKTSNINSVLKKLSHIYSPKIKELIKGDKLNKNYLLFINGCFTNDLSTEIRDNDCILIIPIVTGG